jgi:hypothetical protein
MIGDAVIRSNNPVAKEQGIKTLQAIHSPEALDQLVRILKEGSALQDAGEYAALSQALASYGVQAKPKLLDVFQKAPPENQAVSFSDNLYARYLPIPGPARSHWTSWIRRSIIWNARWWTSSRAS